MKFQFPSLRSSGNYGILPGLNPVGAPDNPVVIAPGSNNIAEQDTVVIEDDTEVNTDRTMPVLLFAGAFLIGMRILK